MSANHCIMELAEDQKTVRFTESKRKIGTINDEFVREMLVKLDMDMLSGSLHKYVYRYVNDTKCCPTCGEVHFKQWQQIDDVLFGFCLNCQTTIHIDKEKNWHQFPPKPPYRRRTNAITGEVLS